MQFVDKQNDLALRVFDFLEDGLEAVFKLATIFCARQHGSEIERDHALVLQDFRDVAGDDSLGEAFDDGGLADAGLADEHRIVLGATGKNLDDAADFFVASDDRVELATTGLLVQVASITLQRLVFGFRILVGNFLRTADHGEGFQNSIVGGAVTGEDLLSNVALEVRDREQQVLGGDVFVFEVGGFFEGLLQQLVRLIRHCGLGGLSGDLGKLFEFTIDFGQHGLRADADLFQHRRNNAFFIF